MRILLLILCLFPLFCFAQAMEKLPITGLYKVTDNDGTRYISEDKRFVFEGRMIDLWTGSNVSKQERFDLVRLNRNGVNTDELAISVGLSEPRLTVFISPRCDSCVNELKEYFSGPIRNKVGLNVMLVSTTEQDMTINKAIWCSKDRESALKSYVISKTVGDIRDCESEELSFINTATIAFGINKLPFGIRGDSLAISGPGFIKELAK